MKKKSFLFIAFIFIYSGIWANTCSTAIGINIRSNLQPDTFQISSTEMWFTFTGDTVSTFYVNNFIDGNYAGINQIDLYSGTCNNLTNLFSNTITDTLIRFKYTFISGNTYYLRLTRPSGLNPGDFTIIGEIGPPPEQNDCPYTNCEIILNGGFDTWGITPPAGFFTNQFNLLLYNICGWKAAWKHPNITGSVANPMIHMWCNTSTPSGEALVTGITGSPYSRPLRNGATYTINYDFFVNTNNGVYSNDGSINFILSEMTINQFPTNSNLNTELEASNHTHLTTLTTAITSTNSNSWQHINLNFTVPATGLFNTFVIDPDDSDNTGKELHIILDNISITESFTANITSIIGSGVTLTANALQTPPNGPYAFLWSTSETTQSINVNTAGTYTVTITNAIFCTAVASINVVVNNLAITTSGTNATCANNNGSATVTVNGVNYPPYNYYWTGPSGFSAFTQNISGLPQGTYYVTVTNSFGTTCMGSQIITSDIFTGANWPFVVSNTSGDQVIHDMVTDANGNVYAIGTFTGIVTFGSFGTFTNTNKYSIFVVKFDKCGNIVNARVYGGLNNSVVYDEKYFIEIIGASNSIAVAGGFSLIDFTTGGNQMNSTDGVDVFLALLNTTTLTATPTQQIQIFSNSTDNVKGISVYTNSIYIAGGFKGNQLQLGSFTPVLNNTSSPLNWDLYVARFNYTLASLTWAKNYTGLYSDNGMTMQVVPMNLYFTYMQNNLSYIARVNTTTGIASNTQQIGAGTDFYNINDMVASGSQLYLCGYKKTSYTNTNRSSVILHYSAPNTNIIWPPTHLIASNIYSANNEATKIITSGTNIFVSGTYDYNNFMIGSIGNWSQSAVLYGKSDHFVYKTDNLLTPNSTSGWLSGVASVSTIYDASRGNALAYDATNSVYYLGGTFTGNFMLTGALGQTIISTAGYDAYVARFQDNGVADYKSAHAVINTINKEENTNVLVYPNPTTGIFKVSSLNNETITEIEITDLTGRLIYKNNVENTAEKEINTSFLPEGTYLISVFTELNNYNLKLVIVK